MLQHAQCEAIEVFEQLGLPAIPHFGAGATNIGNGEQVKRNQVALCANGTGERGNYPWIGQIGLLRHRRHGEVLLDQKTNQCRFVLGQAMQTAEALGVDPTELGVIATAAFCDVVEDRCKVEQPVPVKIGDQA